MIELLGNHLWQSTLCVGAVALLALALRKNRASVRHWLWLAASVKFLVPFAALVAIGSQLGWEPSPTLVRSTAQPNLAVVIDAIGRPFSLPPPAVTGGAAAVPAHSVAAAAPLTIVTLAAPIVLWLVGCGALVLVWTIRWRRVAAAVRRGSPVYGGREWQLLRHLEQIGRAKRPLDVVSSDSPLEPGVFGILKPVLLWPRRMTDRLDEEQIEAILAHELCHVRRRDNLAAAVHAAVQALFWFHPLVWWVGARLMAERERACDEEVVRSGSDPAVYAASILKACQFFIESPRLCMAGVSGADLRKRIEQILANEPGAPLTAWRRLLLGTAGMAAVVGPIAIGVVDAPRLGAEAPRPVNDRRGFGPPDVNRLVGFELLPGPRRHSTDDPRGAVAWRVAFDRPAGRTSLVGFTGRGLIRYAYGLGDVPVVEGPNWIDTESLELSAAAAANATDDELRSVLRTLLEERVKLSVHHETRNFQVYALVASGRDGALGPHLHPSTSACLDQAEWRAAAAQRDPVLRQRPARFCGVENGISGMTFEKVTMTELAESLSRSGQMLDRKVVNRTGLTGAFDATLGFGLMPAAAVLTRYPATAALLEPLGVRTIYRALPEQLGLGLVDASEPNDVLVIDGAKRPWEQ